MPRRYKTSGRFRSAASGTSSGRRPGRIFGSDAADADEVDGVRTGTPLVLGAQPTETKTTETTKTSTTKP